jgi:VanZ family protein
MLKFDKKTVFWCLAGLYTVLIFMGSYVARPLWQILNGVLKGYGILPVYLFIIFGALGAGAWYVLWKKERHFSRYLVLSLIVCAFLSLCYGMEKREEIVHILEFGFLPVPAYFALKQALDKNGERLYLYLFGICAVVGVMDEVVQFFIPGRVCDPRDMMVNTLSGLIGILVLRLCAEK